MRIRAVLSQPELAARAGISRETVSRIEHGRRAWPAVVLRLAEALNVAPERLIGMSELEPRREDRGDAESATTGAEVNNKSGQVRNSEPRTPRSLRLLGPAATGKEFPDRVPAAAGGAGQDLVFGLVPVPHLRRWRLQAGVSQGELALRARVARATISRSEGGRPTGPAVVIRLADALRVAPSMLTGTEGLDALTGQTYRTCTRCGAVRPLTAFVRIRRSRAGYYGACKVCRAAKARARYYSTPEIHEAELARARKNARARARRLRLQATATRTA